MAENGVRSIEIGSSNVLDEVLGNREGSTRRQSVVSLSAQLVASGPIQSELQRISNIEGQDLGPRLTALEEQAFAADPIFATTAEGLAATPEGKPFKVENASPDISYDAFRHVSGGVADLVASVPSPAALVTKAAQTDMLRTQKMVSAVGVSTSEGRFAPAAVQFANDKFANYDSAGGTRVHWVSAGKMADDGTLDQFGFFINDEGRGPQDLQITVMRQTVPSSAQITSLATYETVMDFTGPLSDYYTLASGFNHISVTVGEAPFLRKNERFVVVVRLRDGGGALVPFGMGRSIHYTPAEEAFNKGGFVQASNLNVVQSISSDAKIYCKIGTLTTKNAVANPSAQFGNPAGGGFYTNNSTQVSLNHLLDAALNFCGLDVDVVNVSADTRFVRMRVVLRKAADGDYANTSAFRVGEGTGDTEIFCKDFVLADLMDVRYLSAAQTLRLVMDYPVIVDAGTLVMAELTPLTENRSGYGAFNIAQAAGVSIKQLALEKGGFATSNPPTTLSVTGQSQMAFALLGDDVETGAFYDVNFSGSLVKKQASYDLKVPTLTVSGLDQDRITAARTLTFAPEAGTTSRPNAVNLRFNQWDALDSRWWSGVVVRRNSDNAVLVAGVDYEVDSPTGRIRGLVNTPIFAVTVTISAYRARIDTVFAVPWGSTYQISQGAARFADPDNWQIGETNNGSNGRIEVMRVLVKPVGGIEVINATVRKPQSVLPKDEGYDLRNLREWNHARLGKLKNALAEGEDFKVLFYGDSITAAGSGAEPAWQLVPNGPNRDVVGFYNQTPADGFAQMGVPVYTEDGVQKTRASHMWHVARKLDALHPHSKMSVGNLGIGGTTSGVDTDGSAGGRYGGSNPTRLAALTAAKGPGINIALIAFGTNDDDNTQLVNNIAVIIAHCKANGIVPVVIGQPAVAGTRWAQRLHRNDMYMYAAARTQGAAFVPLSLICHGNRDLSGIFRSLESTSGGTNHPGLFEMRRYGDLIWELGFDGGDSGVAVVPRTLPALVSDFIGDGPLGDDVLFSFGGMAHFDGRGDLHARVVGLPGARGLSDEFGFAEVNADGKVLRAKTWDGADYLPGVLSPTAHLSSEYEYTEVTPTGQLVHGARWDGSRYDAPNGGPLLDALWAERTETGTALRKMRLDRTMTVGPVHDIEWCAVVDTDVYLVAPDRAAFRVTFDGGVDYTYLSADLSGLRLSIVRKAVAGGTVDMAIYALTGTVQAPAGITLVDHIMGTGQSLSIGSSTRGIVTPSNPNQAVLMFNGGVKTLGSYHDISQRETALMPDRLTDLVPAYEVGVGDQAETPLTRMGAFYKAGVSPNRAVLVSAHGIGSVPHVDLVRGTQIYANSLAAVFWARLVAGVAGLGYRCQYISNIQGEGNTGNTSAQRVADLITMQTQYTEDINRITGQNGEVVLVQCQTSNPTMYGFTTMPGMALGQLQVALDNPTKHICPGPKYWCTYSDGTHLMAEYSAKVGEVHGYHIDRFDAGEDALPLHATGAVRSGTNVTLTFRVPDDTTWEVNTALVTNPGNWGLTFHDDGDGNTVTVIGVAQTSPGVVAVTLSAVPTGSTPRIGIAATGTANALAGPASGMRSNFCAVTTKNHYDATAIRLWAAHQFINIT